MDTVEDDGFRLDAIRHLVEEGNGAVTENVPATHSVLRNYSAYIRGIAPQVTVVDL